MAKILAGNEKLKLPVKNALYAEYLSLDAIERSAEIKSWIEQFSSQDRLTAKILLSKLRFISRDSYSSWINNSICALPQKEQHALYSVRKLSKDQESFWGLDHGDVVQRPGSSQGSEDLVHSLISSLVKGNSGVLLDHPSIETLRENRIRSIILIEDSIGSGKRLYGFVNKMLAHPSFLSWWSGGFIRVKVFSYMRFGRSNKAILGGVIGSGLKSLKIPKKSKLRFKSRLAYWESSLDSMWGGSFDAIKGLCERTREIPKNRRLGFGNVMSNTIFFHSVPNNTPGVLWFTNDKWRPLFPGRAVPNWLVELLHNTSVPAEVDVNFSPEILQVLKCIKSGIRSTRRISDILCCDDEFTEKILEKSLELRLISETLRITVYGRNLLKKYSQQQKNYRSGTWICIFLSAGVLTILDPAVSWSIFHAQLAESVP